MRFNVLNGVPFFWSRRNRRAREKDELEEKHRAHCSACRDGPVLHQVTVSKAKPALWETTLSIGGMTCRLVLVLCYQSIGTDCALSSACTSSITRQLLQIPGIVGVSVNLVLASAVVLHDNEVVRAEKIADEVDDIGFEAAITTSKPAGKETRQKMTLAVESARYVVDCSSK